MQQNVQTKVPEGVHIRHIRVEDEDSIINNGGATVAYTAQRDGIHYAVAFCGPNDNFNRHIGRSCALGRLVRCEHKVIDTSLEDFENTLQDLAVNPEMDNFGLSLALNSTIGAYIPAAYARMTSIFDPDLDE
jgi:hypothetical protein